MTAQDILKLIETVSPDDTAKLDEIDARVWCWLNGHRFLILTPNSRDYIFKAKMKGSFLNKGVAWYEFTRPTRSRDALKAIRPEGCRIEVKECPDGFKSWMIRGNDGGRCFSCRKHLPTEELAELHAIIQAIEYERNKDNENK